MRLPNGTPIVLVSIDTLRSDRLPAYGYEEIDTPTLEGFDRSLARPQEVDSETRGKLAALGYLGGTSLPKSEGPPPDPKSRLASLELLQNALALAGAGEDHDAAALLRELLEREPQMTDAWEHLGRVLHRAGRYDEALQAFKRALSLSEGAPRVALDAASLLLDMGQLDEARAHAELALASHEAAYGILAEVALEQEDLEAADRWSREAMARRGTRVQPLVVRARVLVERQRYREALALTREAESELAERPDRDALGGLYLARGKALAPRTSCGTRRSAARRP